MTEKSSNNCDQSLMDLFNTFIGDFQLKEIRRSGPKFTWTNKQDYPVMFVLDRFLISSDWEVRFPLCLAWSLTRVGSDHSPIILDSGEQGNPRTKYFFFENKWLLDQDLVGLVTQKWNDSTTKRPDNCYSMDAWHGSLTSIRQFLKGWGARKAGEVKRLKTDILQQLEAIDHLADGAELSAETWHKRYDLEHSLEQIYQMEELHWKQRGDVN